MVQRRSIVVGLAFALSSFGAPLAQAQRAKVYRIGWLSPTTSSSGSLGFALFQQGLRELVTPKEKT